MGSSLVLIGFSLTLLAAGVFLQLRLRKQVRSRIEAYGASEEENE